MKRPNSFFLVLLLLLAIASCTNGPKDNFVLRGKIKGLKKGVVYLQKDGDSSIIGLDSLIIKGQPEFQLSTSIEEPIVLYLKLFKNDGEEHYIPFFANIGETYITSSLENFSLDADIKGSKQQEVLEEYLTVMSDFNDRNLDLIKATFLAQKSQDSLKVDSLQNASDRLLKRKYAYTINFALNHSDSEVAPYLALYEIPNTSIKYVDSIYRKLNDTIKQSYYGKKLGEVVNTVSVGETED